jgi:hypothetical protein
MKNPAKVRAGRISAAKRWGPRRVVRLDDLNADERSVVLAIVDCLATKKTAPAVVMPGAVATGGHSR